ncbi:hypothetical protein BRADI_2g57692v3 [Brachypodium distachyon]|uniref:Gnk2-homologous domain-containing protein n=1 Tax=Brachypodium distachyon TaxID=15368 RepID=A0A0Q3JEX8_BRADI|nr:hypothetical protein BRADI_2g57692v3 [Brachypodium distachyon]
MPRTFLLVAMAAGMVLAAAIVDDTAGSYGLLQCQDPSSPSSSTFRGDILSLLDDLPATAATTGFANLQLSSGSGAFAWGLCLCLGAGGGPIAPYCSLNFGDTNATSPVEAAYRDCQRHVVSFSGAGRLLRDVGARGGFTALALSLAPRAANSSSGPLLATAATDMAHVLPVAVPRTRTARRGWNVRVRALAQCARDRAPADCANCLRLSAQHLPKCWGPMGEGLAAVSVVAYDCYLGLELAPPPPVYAPDQASSPFCT